MNKNPTGRIGLLVLPVALSFLLAAFSLLPAAENSHRLLYSILGASAALLAFAAVAAAHVRRRGVSLDVSLRPQHYLQACAQSTVLLYWGYYWRPVYEALPLLVAQLVFAYAFDMLWRWWRDERYTLGFAPFPVIFSINLFLWFRPDWFFLQFCMIALGLAAKDLLRWERGGRMVHIFNPSSFPLAVFSLGLILTGTTHWTFGEEIAQTQFNPPNIYLLLFLVGLPGQFLFGVTTMTMSAVVTTYLCGAAYLAITGTYFFIDSYVPVAVFLGMHLLFTDPSTSPRTEAGRIVFGVIYGVSNVVLYALFGAIGVPRFYDKLLPVPLMNLSVRFIDRHVPRLLHAVDPARLGAQLAPRRRNLAYMTLWTGIFIALTSTNGLGDHHPGHEVAFWRQGCDAGNGRACRTLGSILATYCIEGSGWACNERGVLRTRLDPAAAPQAAAEFLAACTRGFQAGCSNAGALKLGTPPVPGEPDARDFPVILRGGKDILRDKTPFELFTLACSKNWMVGCESLGRVYLQGDGVNKSPQQAAAYFEQACNGGLGTSCANLGLMYYKADGLPQDRERGLALLKTGCEKGYANACRWLKEIAG